VCLDVDAGWWPLGGRMVRIGPKRSPVHDAARARRMAEEIEARPGTRLAGLMAYEGQIAGVGDRIPGRPLRSAAIRAMQSASERELRERLPEIVAAVRAAVATAGGELEFVNGGGTGSLARTAATGVVTELAAGSGFYAPALFDHYRALRLEPAAFFCLSVVRRSVGGTATLLGGGYPASGPADELRLPEPYLPGGLRLDRQEGAGEVQTPVSGAAAYRLRVGDRVYLRHAKAGELCERFQSLHLLDGDRIVDEVPTYRGEGKAFL
jgi:D-serine deaminase-like pyridoxal phosphate-dependent protein